MSNEQVMAERETRKSLIRVWLAISAVWVAFWLLIATTVLAAAATRNPFVAQLPIFSIIVLAPPLALLGIGAAARFFLEVCSRRSHA
jgi:hypothetical protein